MVALRGRKAKAKASSSSSSSSRKVTAPHAANSKKSKKRAVGGDAADDDDEDTASSSAQRSGQEQLVELIRFLTQSTLALAGSLPSDLTLPAFLDAMLTAFCGSGKDRSLSPTQILTRLTASTRRRICGVIFAADEIAYSCRDCQVDSTCVICKDCFMHGDHTGHDVYFQRTTAGSSCDCGDPHAWKRSGFCTRHPGVPDEETDAHATSLDSLPKPMASVAPAVIDAVVDQVHQVLMGIEHGFQFAEALEKFTHDIPPHVLTDLALPSRRGRQASSQPLSASDSVGSQQTVGTTRRSRRGSRRSEPESAVAGTGVDLATPSSESDSPVVSFTIRLHNDDVHLLRDVVNDLNAVFDFPPPMAHAAATEVDRVGDTDLANLALLGCAAPVGDLSRRSLNISLTPQWWQSQIESLPVVLEWLRGITMASDGLSHLVSEALQKSRRQRIRPIHKLSEVIDPKLSSRDLLGVTGVRLHPAATSMIKKLVKEDENVRLWAVGIELIHQRRFRFHVDANLTDLAGAKANSCADNVFIEEFLRAASLSRSFNRHSSIRDACNELTKRYLDQQPVKSSTLGLLVRWDCALRVRTARMSHALLREHMLKKNFRKQMLEEYARSYRLMTQSYLNGLGNMSDSIFDFAVQFLTVPHLVKDYTKSEMEKHPDRPRLVFELLSALDHVLSTAVNPSDQSLNVEHKAVSAQKYKHCIDDLEYVFSHGSIPGELVGDPKNLSLWISCLSYLQNGDPQLRRGVHESHVEYESESWLAMFNLGIRVHSIYPVAWNGVNGEEMRQWSRSIPEIAQVITKATISSSRSLNKRNALKSMSTVSDLISFDGQSAPGGLAMPITGYEYNVAGAPTSLHIPLHRFLAASLRVVLVHQDWLSEKLSSEGVIDVFGFNSLAIEDKLELIELPLRSLVMASQIHSNLWRRNGDETMMAQLYNYSALPYCIHYRDADIFLMQLGVLLLGADAVVTLMADRFQLGSFFRSRPGSDKDAQEAPRSAASLGFSKAEEGIEESQQLLLVEELLRLVIVLGTSLPSTTGAEYEVQFIEEEMVQHLCAKSYSFSRLADIAVLPTGQDDVAVPRLEEVLSRVATFNPPSGLEPGRYELKEGMLDRYNPYFLHLNREAHELARDRWASHRKLKRKQRQQNERPPTPLEEPRKPLSFLRPIQKVLVCNSTISILHFLLWRIVQDSQSSSNAGTMPISDAVISTCLHVLVYAMYSSRDTDSSFWDLIAQPNASFDNTSVLSLLLQLEKKSATALDDEQAGTLEWLLWAGKEFSSKCADALKNIQDASVKSQDRETTSESMSANELVCSGEKTLEQRKDEARKRALEAMARQQAAFQAMMVGMDCDGEDDDGLDDDEVDGIVDPDADTSRLGKRRASTESTDDDAKRPRISSEDDTGHKCILCHDSSHQREMGVAAYVHQSTVLSGAFRPDSDEALHADGERVRTQVRQLVEKMDLCSGATLHTPDSPPVGFRSLAAQFPEWYLDEEFDDEFTLDPPLPHADAGGVGGAQPPRPQRGRRMNGLGVLGGELLQTDEELEVLEGVLDLRDAVQLLPNGLRLGNATERGAREGTSPQLRGIRDARNTATNTIESEAEDDDVIGEERRLVPHHHRHHQAHDHHHHHHHHHDHVDHSPENLKLFLTPCGLHIRTCQHAVHIHCLERYIRSLDEKATRGEDFDGVQAIDPDSAMTQFLCPLCKSLCNFLIPTSDPSGLEEGLPVIAQAGACNEALVHSEKLTPRWYDVVDSQLKLPGWCRTVLGRDGDFGDDDGEIHDLWREYYEDTLWEPHGSLEKGAPFLWSSCAFTLSSFLLALEQEMEDGKISAFDPLIDQCPPSLDKEFSSLVAVTKFCRWSFSLLEHSEDAKVIWETAKRCCPINVETKREYRKFTKVLGSIDACLRGTILGLLVADTFTSFVVSSVIADSLSTVWQFIPVFSAADLVQRVYAEFFVQSKHDERSLLQDKYSIVELPSARNETSRKTRSGRTISVSPVEQNQKEQLAVLLSKTAESSPEEHAILALVQRILNCEPDERLKPLTRKDLSSRIERVRSANALLTRRMKLFWRCLTSDGATSTELKQPIIPSMSDVATCPQPVFDQVWKWCVDRINSKSSLGIAKNGDKCEHAEGCGEGYVASMFILRDMVTKPRLIDLPVQYDELYSMLSGQKCKRCDKTPCDPGLCLVCGEFLCCGDSCCARPFVQHGPTVGECTRHAAECGGGVGVVLLLDQCRVAIIGGSMAAYFPCPYVDAHGEEDVGLQRGRPLRLDAARFRYLESLWVGHRIFSEVSRQRNQREPQFAINLSHL
ncbi:hypothetical protein PINS_up000087 [Pythium insidiosum]|nr:hypothetical protein PINS_up000087 [Pythium insidiosum]